MGKETLLSPKKHSKLTKLLAETTKPVYEPYGQNPKNKLLCPCGFRMKNEKHKHQCWFRREKLWSPFRTGQRPDEPIAGLLFRATHRKSKTMFTGVVLADNVAADISDPTHKLLPHGWWNEYTIAYKQKNSSEMLYQLNRTRSIAASTALLKAREEEAVVGR